MENFMKACSLADKKKNGKKVRFMPHHFVVCRQLLAVGLGGLRLGASVGGVSLTLGNVRCDCGDMTCRLVLLVNGLRRYLPACPHSVSCCS